jgi:hypothetical protein
VCGCFSLAIHSLRHVFIVLMEYCFKRTAARWYLISWFSSRNLGTMRLAFTTYIPPILECNSIMWKPNIISLKDLIENLQQHFPKRIASL